MVEFNRKYGKGQQLRASKNCLFSMENAIQISQIYDDIQTQNKSTMNKKSTCKYSLDAIKFEQLDV